MWTGVGSRRRSASQPIATIADGGVKTARLFTTKDVIARFNADAGEGFLPMREAMKALGVSRQTVWQRVKRGELEAVHVMRGKQKGLRIKVIDQQSDLFDRTA